MLKRGLYCILTAIVTTAIILTTLPLRSQVRAFLFASLSDSQDGEGDLSQVTNQIATLNPSLVIFNGDLMDSSMTSSELTSKTNAMVSSGIFNRTFLIRGNHDNENSGDTTTWENFFSTALGATRTLPAGVTNYTAMDSNSTYLTYSFDYGNARFIGLDVPGDARDYVDSSNAQTAFLDARLTDAENKGLQHAFIYWHGPDYCVESQHCDCTAKLDGSCTPSEFITIVNRHPIVSATFHGHEHILGWVHMDNTRVPGLTHPYEEFITSPSGGYLSYYQYLYPNRMDYVYPLGTGAGDMAFGTVDVNGASFTVNLYKVGTTTPVWSKTFTKSGGTATTSTPTPTSGSTTATLTPTQIPGATATPTPTQQTGATSTPTPTFNGIRGDANGDGKVDEADYNIWLAHYMQQVGGGPSVGDFNNDLVVDGVDYVLWLINFNAVASTSTPTPTQGTGASATPTPTSGGSGGRITKYYGVDRVRSTTDFATLGNWGINTAVVDMGINDSSSSLNSVVTAAANAGISIVIWPNQGGDVSGCGWETPFNSPDASGNYIGRVTGMLNILGGNEHVIGIVIAHEAVWNQGTCKTTIADMAAIKNQITNYIHTNFPNRVAPFKIWNYIDNLSDMPNITDYSGPSDIPKIMDVAATWEHCAGNAESPCDGSGTTAISKINQDRSILTNANINNVDLVFLQDTFISSSPYNTKFTLDQLKNYSCEFLNTNALDGFVYYTWDEGWYSSNLKSMTDLQPAVSYVHSTCVH